MNTEKWTEEAASAEFDRLEGSVPYGVCFQVSLEALRALKTPEEGRVFYAKWRTSDVISAKGRTDLVSEE